MMRWVGKEIVEAVSSFFAPLVWCYRKVRGGSG